MNMQTRALLANDYMIESLYLSLKVIISAASTLYFWIINVLLLLFSSSLRHRVYTAIEIRYVLSQECHAPIHTYTRAQTHNALYSKLLIRKKNYAAVDNAKPDDDRDDDNDDDKTKLSPLQQMCRIKNSHFRVNIC